MLSGETGAITLTAHDVSDGTIPDSGKSSLAPQDLLSGVSHQISAAGSPAAPNVWSSVVADGLQFDALGAGAVDGVPHQVAAAPASGRATHGPPADHPGASTTHLEALIPRRCVPSSMGDLRCLRLAYGVGRRPDASNLASVAPRSAVIVAAALRDRSLSTNGRFDGGREGAADGGGDGCRGDGCEQEAPEAAY
jgi:hypothetical protein